jgi:uncharacterized membrane protein HdeD (DUF308 family)
MRIVRLVLGSLLVVIGAVWIVQGIGVLPGSFMTGQPKWAMYGGIALVVGLLQLIYTLRKR